MTVRWRREQQLSLLLSTQFCLLSFLGSGEICRSVTFCRQIPSDKGPPERVPFSRGDKKIRSGLEGNGVGPLPLNNLRLSFTAATVLNFKISLEFVRNFPIVSVGQSWEKSDNSSLADDNLLLANAQMTSSEGLRRFKFTSKQVELRRI